MQDWEEKAAAGDFSAIPDPLRWADSAKLAHFLNGYEVMGGFEPLANLATRMMDYRTRNGRWGGNAIELWLCLFFQHRAVRHTGEEQTLERLKLLDDLCQELREALRQLGPNEVKDLIVLFSPNDAAP